jgi:hypothetical protein
MVPAFRRTRLQDAGVHHRSLTTKTTQTFTRVDKGVGSRPAGSTATAEGEVRDRCDNERAMAVSLNTATA